MRSCTATSSTQATSTQSCEPPPRESPNSIAADNRTCSMIDPHRISTGLDVFLDDPPPDVRGARLGLLMNQASRDRHLRLSCDAIAQRRLGRLTALFSPQHGLWGVEQANMIESPHSRYEPLDVPVYSLYAETRQPTAEMLEQVDVLLIDLQDVGTRVYTFAWTMCAALRACSQYGRPAIVLDRPNPIGGVVVEGPMLSEDHLSFVGGWPIPLRHGLTLGELARLYVAEAGLDVDLTVLPMRGWRRTMTWSDTGRQWIWPSPNMPTPTTAAVYPGMVLLEGTNLSEGRGTTRPFEICGAPWVDGLEWEQKLADIQGQPWRCLATRFQPTFDKWAGQVCAGVDLQLLDARRSMSVPLAVALISLAARTAPQHFRWLDPPYEYETIKAPIDILFGDSRLRQFVDSATGPPTLPEIEHLLQMNRAAWQQRCAPILLYS
ncbi:MAG: DUF1343 domain-containing protein [Planctomycetota bacterium]|nr:MAG: DUF1343 domain-containing protein [Planctomycetota bacterium]